jgi:hypothetical protein
MQNEVNKFLASGPLHLDPVSVSFLGFDQPDHAVSWLRADAESGTSGFLQRIAFIFPKCLEKLLANICNPPQVRDLKCPLFLFVLFRNVVHYLTCYAHNGANVRC